VDDKAFHDKRARPLMTNAPARSYRIAIIGGGVVGCAVLRGFALAGLRPVLLERGSDILGGASKANSAILHSGFDAASGSLELSCVRAGHRAYLEVRERLNLPLVETGGLVVAWNEDEAAKLPVIVEKARANGLGDVRQIDRAELFQREPNLADGAVGAVEVPGEHIIDPWSAPLAYALQAIANGAEVRRGCEVLGGAPAEGGWRLETSEGEIHAEVVVNSAGLHGDLVEAICRESPFTIRPRKGQFIVFDKPAAALVQATILAVPDARTKGVLLARTAFGNLLLGPTAEDQDDRERAAVDADALAGLLERGTRMLPGLAGQEITATFAGLRPASQHQDYRIEALPERRWISVGGIRSTGLTGSLGIAEHLRGLYGEHFGPLDDLADPVWPRVPNLSEYQARPYQGRDCGEIVCHCEWVTRGEIEAALSGPLPAGDLGGLRRRTRCMLGRCQGFYCAGRIARLAVGRLGEGLATEIGA
jgi:glycerol-3-phosphate dehydrogenase